MFDDSRLEQLRRRVRKDPASILFAQLADECRRAGLFDEAIDVCRAGLAHHPGYISARVTLGRSLAGLARWDAAQRELQAVLRAVPDHLAALRGLAEVYHRRGQLNDALAQYQAALDLAPGDAELVRLVQELAQSVDVPSPVTDEAADVGDAGDGSSLRRRGRDPLVGAADLRAIARLEQWLNALHGIRAQHGA